MENFWQLLTKTNGPEGPKCLRLEVPTWSGYEQQRSSLGWPEVHLASRRKPRQLEDEQKQRKVKLSIVLLLKGGRDAGWMKAGWGLARTEVSGGCKNRRQWGHLALLKIAVAAIGVSVVRKPGVNLRVWVGLCRGAAGVVGVSGQVAGKPKRHIWG